MSISKKTFDNHLQWQGLIGEIWAANSQEIQDACVSDLFFERFQKEKLNKIDKNTHARKPQNHELVSHISFACTLTLRKKTVKLANSPGKCANSPGSGAMRNLANNSAYTSSTYSTLEASFYPHSSIQYTHWEPRWQDPSR